MRVSVCIAFIALGLHVNAQITFQRTYGVSYNGNSASINDSGTSVKQTSDGGYIVTGIKDCTWQITDPCEYDSIYLIKLDPSGKMQWTKSFGTSKRVNKGNSIALSNDGGFVIAGASGSWCPWVTPISYSYFLKTDLNGLLQWTGTLGYGFSGNPDETAFDIKKTNDGGYIVAGQRIQTNFSQTYDSYLMKLSSSGTYQWSVVYGDTTNACAYATCTTLDNGYVLAGRIDQGFNQDMHLVKTSSNGNMLWDKTYDATFNELLTDVIQTSDGEFILLGNTDGTADDNILLLKCDSDGALLWNKAFGGSYRDLGGKLKQTGDGGFIIAGTTESYFGPSYACLIKSNSNGNLLWSKVYGGTNAGALNSIELTQDGGYIMTGHTNAYGTGTDIYVIKTDSDGNSNCNETPGNISVKTYSITISSKGTGMLSWNVMDAALITYSGGRASEDSLCVTTGIDDNLAAPEIQVYPNPFFTSVTVKCTEGYANKNSLLEIFDVFGRKLRSAEFTGPKLIIDRGNLPSGVYVYSIYSEGRHLAVGKLIAE